MKKKKKIGRRYKSRLGCHGNVIRNGDVYDTFKILEMKIMVIKKI